MKSKKGLLSTINKDVISVKVCIIDDKTEEYYLHTTDYYFIRDKIEQRAFVVGHKFDLFDNSFEITEINMELMINGLVDFTTPPATTYGVINPYSAILNVLVKKIGV